jgi:hypothetical protein
LRSTEFTTPNIKIKDTVTGSYGDQIDGALIAYTDDDSQVGYLEYSIYDDVPSIKMIWVVPEYRRYKIAMKMLRTLQSMHPEKEIDWGYTTPDGSNLKNSIDFEKKPNPEVIKKKQKLSGIKSRLQKLNYRLEQMRSRDPKLAGQYISTVSDRWNKFNDLEYGLENELWDKKEYTNLIREQYLSEAPLADYVPIGDFNKPGPFRGVDKKLVQHPTNQLKTATFFENTNYDFRLFFSNISGTGKYAERGVVPKDQIKQIFGEYADQILQNSENTITIVFVGNSGAEKVMLTPWIMAHRFGHAIQATSRYSMNGWSLWKEAEKHFFNAVNGMLSEYYGKSSKTQYGRRQDDSSMKNDLTPEYNALFNAIGTQRSSRSNKIKRPYEFLYELFAQYLGTGKITLNELPVSLGYGRKAWGNPTNFLNLKSEYRNDEDAKYATDILSRDLELLFDDVLSASVGNIFVM